jgi:hypothetical protein
MTTPMTNSELAAALDDESRVVGFKVRHEAAARLREMEIERDNWKRLYEEESAEYAEVAGAGDTRAVQTVVGRLKRELAEAREELAREKARADALAQDITREEGRELQSVLRTLSGRGPVLIRSARELVKHWENEKARADEAERLLRARNEEAVTLRLNTRAAEDRELRAIDAAKVAGATRDRAQAEATEAVEARRVAEDTRDRYKRLYVEVQQQVAEIVAKAREGWCPPAEDWTPNDDDSEGMTLPRYVKCDPLFKAERQLAECREALARLQTDYSATRQRCDEQAEEIERLRAQLCSIAEVLDGAGVVADSLTDGVAQLLTAVEDAEQREAEQAHAIENYQRHARESAATIIEQAERIKGLEVLLRECGEVLGAYDTDETREFSEGLLVASDWVIERIKRALAADRPATVEK